MKYLKIFESDEFNVNEEDIKDIFTDFEDEGFKIFVKFGKRLHQFHEMDSKLTNREIKLGFKLCIWVDLRSNEINIRKFMQTDRYLDLLNNVQFRLSHENLYIKETEVRGTTTGGITLLIYSK